MQKIFVFCLFLIFPIFLFAQEQEATSKAIDSVAGINTGGGDDSPVFKSKGFHFFNVYFEWGSGDILQPVSKRIIRELFDVKASYLYTFASVPWLSVGLTSQFQVSPKWSQNNTSLGKTSLPDSLGVSADIMFGRIFDIALGSDGTLTATLLYSRNLPEVSGLKSHSFTFLSKTAFFLRGNVYDTSSGTMRQGWWDNSELRLQYQMRFNDYVGLRPEITFAVIGTGILAGKSFLDNFIMRINPRLYMYAPGGWSFFLEPRLFFYGWGSPTAYSSKPAVELKFGIDYAALWQ